MMMTAEALTCLEADARARLPADSWEQDIILGLVEHVRELQRDKASKLTDLARDVFVSIVRRRDASRASDAVEDALKLADRFFQRMEALSACSP